MFTAFNFANEHFVGLSLMYYGGLIVWLAHKALRAAVEGNRS